MLNSEVNYITKFDKKTKIKLKTSENVFQPTATSDFLIKAVAENINTVDSLLDLGCGNGIVGITLSKLKKTKKIYCSDISREAVEISKVNIKLNHCNGETKISDIFSNWSNYKFDVIVNDISGISEEIAKLSSWFKNVPCNSGLDGCKNIEKVLLQGKNFIKEKGKIFFPVISLSDTSKILRIANDNYKNVYKLSHDKWFLPEDLKMHLSILNDLKNKGYLDYCEKFGKLICWTEIYMAS